MKPFRILLLVPIVYLAAVADTTLADRMQVGTVAPDLLALVAVVWLLLAGREYGFLVAGGIGLVGDLISPGRIGLGMACYLLVGYALVRLRRHSLLEYLGGQVAVVWAAVTLIAAAMAAGHWLLGQTRPELAGLLAQACGVGLYTAGISLPLLMVIGWIREPVLTRRRKLAEF